MNAMICKAIRTKKVIEFEYDGRMRVVEPFCYGCSTKNNDILRAYQIGGFSSSGNPDGWRLYTVNKMSNLKMKNNSFAGNRQYYNPNDKSMVEIYYNI